MDLAPSIAALFSRFARPSSVSASDENPAQALGRRGEAIAARYLKRHRYRVLYQNFRAKGGGEVDIVCRDRSTDELVFAEVKTRRTRDFGDPARAVDAAKRRLITRGALAWLRMLDHPDIRFRFDIVEVIIAGDSPPEVKVINAAFGLPHPYLY